MLSAAGRKVANALKGIGAIGIPTSALIAGHSISTSLREVQSGRGGDRRHEPVGTATSATVTGAGLRVTFPNAELDLALVADEVLRIEWTPGSEPFPIATDAGVPWKAPEVACEETGNGWRLTGGDLAVDVLPDGTVRVGETWEARPPIRRGSGWVHRARLHPEERIFGLGLQAAPLNLRGQTFQLWNRDPGGSYGPGQNPLYMSIPVYLGLHARGSYLAFHENSHRGEVTVGARLSASFAGGMLRTYLAVGSPAEVLERYGELTGKPPLPPRWALGYHQSRWGYGSQEEIAGIARRFSELDIPLSAIHLDLDYMDGFRVFTVDSSAFPDMPGLAADLADGGIRLVAIIDCGVKVDEKFALYREGLDGGHFCTLPDGSVSRGVVWPGLCVFPDFTNAETCTWWGAQYGPLLDAGITGIWHDMNEPTSLALWGDRSLLSTTRHDLGGRGGDHVEAHNIYGLAQNRSAFDALRGARPERRPFLLSRSGWAGMQSHAWHWTADVDTCWEGLAQQIPSLLGLSLSGIAYSGSDIGGFSASPGAELYLRWLQAGVFTPFARTHSSVSTKNREPWCFDEETRAAIRETVHLRYRILPYLYTLADDAATRGLPLLRPIWWVDRENQDLWDTDDCFLLGSDLLVAPVTAPGMVSRVVKLPGGFWYRLDEELVRPEADFNEAAVAGSRQAAFDAPLERIPVLARAGSIIPLAEPHAGTRAVDGSARLELHVFADAAGRAEGRLFDDAGDGYGPVRRDHFTLRRSGPGRVLKRTSRGSFPAPPGFDLVFHGLAVSSVEADGESFLCDKGRVTVPGGFRELRIGGEG